ncbi:MAG: ParB N-terminal domain-containing protein [Streptosporangiaceae bacterium]|nr:ParB N-terminal domain-containing protein [Streptosporangiaceae bacterium]
MRNKLSTAPPISERLSQRPFIVQRQRNSEIVPIALLITSPDWPRLNGEDKQHTLRLAETDAELPPILVHRQKMVIIDGMHRLRAAILKGQESIAVEFFDGSDEEAFLQAIKANTTHGLPLSMEDRRAAARKIIVANPDLSDRYIAAYSGLSDKTVGMIRRSMGAQAGLNTRLGVDGRVRPLNGRQGRQRAADVISQRPTASLREIAEEAGISIGTAHDVRKRMHRGEGPLPSRNVTCRDAALELPSLGSGSEPLGAPIGRLVTVRPDPAPVIDHSRLMDSLAKDPALRHTERGREMLRLLRMQVTGVARLVELADTVPPHRTGTIARIARQCEKAWGRLAQELERRNPDN